MEFFMDNYFMIIWRGIAILICAGIIINTFTAVVGKAKYIKQKNSFKNDDFWKN